MSSHIPCFGKAEESIDQTLHVATGVIPRTDKPEATDQRWRFEGNPHRHCGAHGGPNDKSWACSQPLHELFNAAGCLLDGDLLRRPCRPTMSQDIDGDHPRPVTEKCALPLPNPLI